MALKFRRGTTAQQSGSLAFGEPYVNTTLGTLLVGGVNGDIALLINSSSQGISGSSLNITGNAKIDGDLSLGGKLTIGDATSDTVNVVASLSSSLIPTVTNAFDLGASDKIWRDLYISTGSIKFIDGGSVVNTFSSNTLTTILQSTGSTDARLAEVGIVTGSLISSASAAKTKNDSQDVSITNINTFSGSQLTQNTNLATITGSLIVSASNAAIADANQNTFTASVSTRLTEIGVVSGSLISSASADRVSITNINTFSGSQLTQNTALATITGSLITTASVLTAFSASVYTKLNQAVNTFSDVSFASVSATNATFGVVTANEFHTSYVTSSVMYNSGSNRFGDSVDDLQQLIGIVEITGSIKGTQFNDLATITGSLISSASSFESRNASLATITGSLISSASSFESRNVSLATITGSLISSASSFESRNVSLATITGSLITTASNHEQRIAANESISSSYARTNLSNTFNNDQTFSGSINLTGRVTAQLAVSASGLNINKADGNVQIELANSTTGRGFHIISYNGSSLSIHNPSTNQSTLRIDSGSAGYHLHLFGDLNVLTGSISSSVGYSGSINGIGNVTEFSSSLDLKNTNLATITGSLIITASNNVNSISNINTTTASLNTSVSNINSTTASLNTSVSNINTFSASQLTQNSSLATITGSLITTSSNNVVSIANLNSYTSSLNNAIQLTGSTVSFLGNIVVYGTQSILYSENLQVNDNIIYLSPSGAADIDLGIVGHYNDGTYRHGGIFRDASDSGTWKVFKGLTAETSGSVDTSHVSFALADFKAAVFTGTSFNGTINADNGIVSGSSQINLASVTGNSTSNVTEGSNLYYLDTRVKTKLNAEGVISGSSQINLASVTGNSTSNVSEGSNLYYLDSRVKTKLNAEGVISGSSQIVGSSITTNTITIGSTSTALGGTSTSLSGLTSVSSTGFTGALTGNASTATTLQTARLINGTSFDGSANITIQNLVSGSSQITLAGVTGYSALATTYEPIASSTHTIVSGSSQIDATSTTNWATGIKTRLDANTVISGSSQVTLSATAGYGSVLNQAVLTSSTPTFAGLTINGAITATGDITAYYSSDKRYKNNIQPITDALAKVRTLNGVTWEWNDDVSDVTKAAPKTGLIAQEVQSVLPEVVKEKEDGFLGLDYAKMMGLMVEAIKEQQLQIDKLTLKVAELEKQKGL